jgi:hypothetical protein
LGESSGKLGLVGKLTIPITVPISSTPCAFAVWTKARGENRRMKKAKRPRARPDRCLAMVMVCRKEKSSTLEKKYNEEKEK